MAKPLAPGQRATLFFLALGRASDLRSHRGTALGVGENNMAFPPSPGVRRFWRWSSIYAV